jgi:hypothetical protein
MTFNEQLRIQSTTTDEQTITLGLTNDNRTIAMEVMDGDENETTIDIPLSLSEAEMLMAKLGVMIAQARMAQAR